MSLALSKHRPEVHLQLHYVQMPFTSKKVWQVLRDMQMETQVLPKPPVPLGITHCRWALYWLIPPPGIPPEDTAGLNQDCQGKQSHFCSSQLSAPNSPLQTCRKGHRCPIKSWLPSLNQASGNSQSPHCNPPEPQSWWFKRIVCLCLSSDAEPTMLYTTDRLGNSASLAYPGMLIHLQSYIQSELRWRNLDNTKV